MPTIHSGVIAFPWILPAGSSRVYWDEEVLTSMLLPNTGALFEAFTLYPWTVRGPHSIVE